MATSAVEPHDFGLTGRGLRTTRAVSAGEELLAVPLDECWHGESARASAVPTPFGGYVEAAVRTALAPVSRRAPLQ